MAERSSDIAARYMTLLGSDRREAARRRSAGGPVSVARAASTGFDRALADDRIRAVDHMLERRAAAHRARAGDLDEKRAIVIAAARETAAKLANEGTDAELTPEELAGAEAIVIADGSRPTLRFAGEALDLDDAELGEWDELTHGALAGIEEASLSVGRIDLDGRHVGTGFVVCEDLVVTNRHVLQGLAFEDGGRWSFGGRPTINFDSAASPALGVPLEAEVVFTGPDAIDPYGVDFRKLDVAVLRMRPAAGQRLPPALELEDRDDFIRSGRPIFAIGYPGKPQHGHEPFGLLVELFDFTFGVKRFAPGEIDEEVGALTGDATPPHTMSYDCTTLGGNSGSPVFGFDDGGRVVLGVHFAGARRIGNYAHPTSTISAPGFRRLDLAWRR